MCGIAGILDFSGSGQPHRDELLRMSGELRHRGPDGDGAHVEGCIGLAHTRLSIIDLEGGTQPIFNEDRSIAVVFNGEIFNYRELTGELAERGHRFATHSDTEVLVHLYEDHGPEMVDHLNGQFAFAIWDRPRRRLLLARDRVGIRPLYYADCGNRLYFASEIKALFAQGELPRALEPMALGEVASLWAPIAPRTAFRGIHALPPGHIMVVSGRVRSVHRYWDWQFPAAGNERCLPEAEEVDALRALLVDAVTLQLRADVPVGAYLSGGLDSSLIAAIVRQHSTTPLRTFSMTFEDAQFDESAHQREMSAVLQTEHSSILVTANAIAEAFPEAIRAAEAPLVRTAPVPLLLLSRHVRDCGFKVVLSGEGADETFAGYDLFKEAKLRRFIARDADSPSRLKLIGRLYPWLKHSPVGSGGLSAALFKETPEDIAKPWFSHLSRWRATARMHRYFSADLRDAIGPFTAAHSLSSILPMQAGSWSALSRDQYLETHTLLSEYLLSSQGDRVAMANSIEGRVPFLDHRLVEFAAGLPPQRKLFGLKEKYLLKKAAARWLPASIIARTKQPYRAPDATCFFVDGRPREMVADSLSETQLRRAGYFDPRPVAGLVRKCASGRALGFADNMAFIMILSTMLLHRSFVDAKAA